MTAATLLTLDGGTRDRFGDREEVAQVECRVPARVVLAPAIRRDLLGLPGERLDFGERRLHLAFAPNDPDAVLHDPLQLVLDLVGAGARCVAARLRPLERGE